MARSKFRKFLACGAAAGLCLGVVSCRREPVADAAARETTSPPPSPALAGARLDLAAAALARADRDDALALVVSALRADPASAAARARFVELLRTVAWHLPERDLPHGAPVTQVVAGGDSLWVGVGAPVGTILRWDLTTESLAAVMFPRPGEETRSLVVSPGGSHVVVERGATTLLCEAAGLKPIREIGPLPDFVTPRASVVFSPDSLLMAHPERIDGSGPVWRIRDTKTGEILRSTEPDEARPLAAFLGADALRVLHADGGLLRVPISPVEEISRSGIEGNVLLHHAVFSAAGGSALVLQDAGPHEAPVVSLLSYGEEDPPSLEAPALLERDSWSAVGPSLWTGLLRDPEDPWVCAADGELRFPGTDHAPVRAGAEITAFAISGNRIVTGDRNGRAIVHCMLPRPGGNTDETPPAAIDPALLGDLALCLAGCRYEETERSFVRADAAERLDAFGRLDADALQAMFPELDLQPVLAALRDHKPRVAPPAALVPMWSRVALSDPARASWPAILEASAALKETEWHQELAAAVLAMAAEPDAETAVERAIGSADDEAVETAIREAGASGPAAAKALALAIASTRPEWIEACLEQAENLPLTLRCLALSRVAWLEDRKADAIAIWPDGVPTYDAVRSREDWEGWEQADFQPAFEILHLCVREELDAIEVPGDPDADQRAKLAGRLLDPATLRAVGRERYAQACLDAALVFSAHKEDVETTLRLAELARNLGAEPAPCLRAEAMAYTSLGDFRNARERWIELITRHPVEAQLPGDYAEAAYTSFENGDPQQAMQILTTGTHRFPNDANFALRAGWVSLLTGNSERAYRFLTTGRRIGYPPEKLENATLLLAIAAAQTGAYEDAMACYEDLKRLDDDWNDPATIDTLEWPEELKASLRELAW